MVALIAVIHNEVCIAQEKKREQKAVCDWKEEDPRKPGDMTAWIPCYPQECTLDLSEKIEVRCLGSYSCEVVNTRRCSPTDSEGKLFICKDVLYGKPPITLTKVELLDPKIRCDKLCATCKTGWRKYKKEGF